MAETQTNPQANSQANSQTNSHVSSQANGQVKPFEDARRRYNLPIGNKELDRLRWQHQWIKGSCGPLIKVPIDLKAKGLKVLDSATSDGSWILDVRDFLPEETELIGFDIAPEIFPPTESIPPNIKLVAQDVTKPMPEEWKNNFDLVNQRLVLNHFKPEDIKKVVRQLFNCVKPGGWIQLVEYNVDTHVSDSRATCYRSVYGLSRFMILTVSIAHIVIEALEEAGGEDVGVIPVMLKIGSSHENPEMGMLGAKNASALLDVYLRHLKPETVGMTGEQWKKYPANLVEDMRKYKTAMQADYFCARKPFPKSD